MKTDTQKFHYIIEDSLSSLLAATVVVAGVAPKFLPAMLLILFVVAIATDILQNRRFLKITIRHPIVTWALAAAAFTALGAFWALDPARATSAACGFFITTFVGVYCALSLSGRMRLLVAQRRDRFVRSIPIGMTIACFFIIFETIFVGTITNAVVRTFPSIAGDFASGFVVRQDRFSGVMHFHYNRAVAALLILFPAALVLCKFWSWSSKKHYLVAFLWLLISLVVLLSDSETSKFAFLFAIFVGCAALFVTARTAGLVLSGLFAALLIFSIPFGKLPFALNLHKSEIIPESGRERFIIWQSVSETVMEHPLIGHGGRSSQKLGLEHEPIRKLDEDRKFKAWHPHNMFLQIWLELGAIGALFFLGFGWTILRGLGDLTETAKPYGVALAAIVLTSAQVGWGLWQTWWIAAVGLGVIGITIANACHEPSEPHSA